MPEWLSDVLGKAGFALVGFAAAVGALWVATRKQRAEYENYKRRRRLTDAKDDERTERAKTHMEMLINLKKYDISPDEVVEFGQLIAKGKTTPKPPRVGPVTVENAVLKRTAREVVRAKETVQEAAMYWYARHVLELRDAGKGRTPWTEKDYDAFRKTVEGSERHMSPTMLGDGSDYERGRISGSLNALVWMLYADDELQGLWFRHPPRRAPSAEPPQPSS